MSNEKVLTVPTWVTELFRDASGDKSDTELAFLGKDAPEVLYAQRELSLAYNNLKFFTEESQVREEKQRMAENLLFLGQYEGALSYAQTDELKKRILKVSKAVYENDGEFCSCADDFINGTNVPISRFRIVQIIFSPIHSKLMNVKECMKCGFVNATDEKTETEKLIEVKTSNLKGKTDDEKAFQ